MFFSRRRRMGEYGDEVAQDQMPSQQGPVVYSGWAEQQQREIMKERQKQIKKQAEARAKYIKELQKRQRKAQEEAQKRAEREWKAMKKIMDQESKKNPSPLFRDQIPQIPAPSFSPSIHTAPERSKEIDHPFIPAPNPPESILPAPIIPPPQKSTVPSTNWNSQQRPTTAWWDQPVGVYTEEYQMEFRPGEVVEGVKNLPAAAAEVAQQAMSFDLLAPLARGAQAVAESLPTVEYTGFSDQEYPERSHYFESMPASKGIGFGASKAVADIHQMRTDVITSGVDYYRGLTDDQLKTAMQQGDAGASFEYNKRFPAYATMRTLSERARNASGELIGKRNDDIMPQVALSAPAAPSFIPIPEPAKLDVLGPTVYNPPHEQGFKPLVDLFASVNAGIQQFERELPGKIHEVIQSGAQQAVTPGSAMDFFSYAMGPGQNEASRAIAAFNSGGHGKARWQNAGTSDYDLPQNYLAETVDGAKNINELLKGFSNSYVENVAPGFQAPAARLADSAVKAIAPTALIKKAERLIALNPSVGQTPAGYSSYDAYVRDLERTDDAIRAAYKEAALAAMNYYSKDESKRALAQSYFRQKIANPLDFIATALAGNGSGSEKLGKGE